VRSKITHATRPTKINAKGELSFIGIYTQLKAYILALLLTRTILIIILKKPHAIGLKGYESYDKLIMGVGCQQLSSKWSFKSSVFSNFKKPMSQDLSIYWMIKQIVLVFAPL
jgi:iron complex outermembrane receptor protein